MSDMKSREGKSSTERRTATWGYLLALISGLAYSLCSVTVKHIKNIHPSQLVFYRCFANVVFALPQFVYSNQSSLCPRGNCILILILSILWATSILLHFITFRYLPLGEAAALISTVPAFVVLAGRVFLKESIGLVQVISLLTTLGGLVLITRVYETLVVSTRVYSTEDIYGLTAGLASLLTTTVTMILMRKLKNVHSSVLTISTAIAGMIECAHLTMVLDKFRLHYKGLQQVLIILLGIGSYLTAIAVTLATQHAEVGSVSTMRGGADILFSLLWQINLFNDVPDGFAICGAILVCISVFLIGFTERINRILPERCLSFC